jgi:uncharacterized protein
MLADSDFASRYNGPMRSAIRPRSVSGVLLLVLSSPARGAGDAGASRASFDCTKASTRVEKMTCADDEASELDRELADAYRRALRGPAENQEELRSEQRAWLSNRRNRCADVECLRRAYRARMAALVVAPARPDEAEVRWGTSPVCEHVRQDIQHRWPALRGGDTTTGLAAIEWDKVDTGSLPPELRDADGKTFDFDNDGVPDRVFHLELGSHYMEGTVLFVERGPDQTDRWFLPCQLDARAIAVEECPLFSQKYDEAGFAMQGKTAKEKPFFRARYISLAVFRFEESTFIFIENAPEGTYHYVAVIKPISGKKFERICLLREKFVR